MMTITILPKNQKEAKKIKTILKAFEVTFIDDSEVVSWNDISDAEKESIKRGLEDIEAGRTVPHSEVLKTYSKYL